MEEINQRYVNPAIARFNMIMANEATAIMGRATGKTYGLHGERAWAVATEMPRSLNGLVSESFRKMLMYLLPPIIKFFTSKGLVKNEHFFIRGTAPKAWDWPLPYNEVMDYSYFVHLPTGAGMIILSQDLHTTNNGASLDHLQIDEVNKLDKKRLDEDFPAMRGNLNYFHDSPLYAGALYTTDMPMLDEELWVLDHKTTQTFEKNEAIFQLAQCMAWAYMKWVQSDFKSNYYQKQYSHYEREWRKARFDSRYYLEATSFENMFILGDKWYQKQIRNMTPESAAARLFTLRPQVGASKFFPFLKKKIHTYTATNNSHLAGIEWDLPSLKPNSRWDDDITPEVPIELTFDHNAYINVLAVCQEDQNRFRVKNAFWVEDIENKRVYDLCKEFSEYYSSHPNRDLYYYWDNTDNKRDDRQLGTTKDDIIRYLSDMGWTVYPFHTGNPSNHVDRKKFFDKYLSGEYEHLPTFGINLDNAEVVYEAMKRTNVAPRSSSQQAYGIDKSTEGKADYPQKYSTHFPEAIAKIVIHKYKNRAERGQSTGSSMAG